MRCEQMLEHDELIEAKELELALLCTQLAAARSHQDWLPTFELLSTWNAWTEEEKM